LIKCLGNTWIYYKKIVKYLMGKEDKKEDVDIKRLTQVHTNY